MRGLAYRRAQIDRWKARVRRYFYSRPDTWSVYNPTPWQPDAAFISAHVHTRKRCSCDRCQNHRYSPGEPSPQERRAQLAMIEDLHTL